MAAKRRYFIVSVDADELEAQGFDPTDSCDFTTLVPYGMKADTLVEALREIAHSGMTRAENLRNVARAALDKLGEDE